ncbi:MAG TPA: diguanylate cyclase [Gammaproteobacteria bacterium]|nr:diguanylate cyclase [Gammaproteobacteria bacterium]
MTRKPTQLLVVDGSEVARTVVSRILEEEMKNATVTTCGSGAEAVQWLEQERFDLITTALMLPDMDGLDLSRRVRGSSRHHYTPVIVVSGDADSRLLREGFAAGVTDYFDKGLGYRAFVEFIKEFSLRNSGLVGRVLYVEDSPTAAEFTRRLMERHGLQVVHTATAEQAMSLLREATAGAEPGSDGFDVVITDFYLQGRMTGGDLLHAIRAKFHFSQQEMPVLVLTAPENDRKQVEVFHAGANDFVTKPIVEEILLARIRSLLLIKQQFNALKRQNEEMRRLAITDSLTGVRNKRYLLDHGEQFVADRHRYPVTAMLLDIDHFKKINDNLGHITGDRVLEALGQLFLAHVSGEVMVVRFGGEEFALLLPRCPLREAQARAEELRTQVEKLRPAGVATTISIGVASTQSDPGMDLTQLLSAADKALYAAKEYGRNRVCA